MPHRLKHIFGDFKMFAWNITNWITVWIMTNVEVLQAYLGLLIQALTILSLATATAYTIFNTIKVRRQTPKRNARN